MSPKCRHRLNSCELSSDSERGETVDFPSSHDIGKAPVRCSSQFLILGPWVRVPPGAFEKSNTCNIFLRLTLVFQTVCSPLPHGRGSDSLSTYAAAYTAWAAPTPAPGVTR